MSRPDVFLGIIDGGIPVVATDDGRGRALCVTEDKHWTMTREWENVEDRVRLVPEDHPLFGVRTPVHNHGTEEGPGLACREHTLTDGTLLGECMIPTLTEDRDWWKERTKAAQDRALELAHERIEARSSVTRSEAAEARTAPAVTKEDIVKAVRSCPAIGAWNGSRVETEGAIDAVWSLVSGDNPAVYVVRESDIEDCQRNEHGDWEFRHSGRVFHDSRDPKDRVNSLAHHREQIAQRAAIIRAIEAEQAVDPVESRARELYRAATPDARWETVADEYRRIARHVIGQEADQ